MVHPEWELVSGEDMSRLHTMIAKLGRTLRDNFLLIVPLVFIMMPVAAYLEYGPGAKLYGVLSLMVPAIALVSYFMIRFHREYQDAYKDNSDLVARLQQGGWRVKATVLDVSQSNAFINEMPVMKITLEYRANGKPYKKTLVRVMPYDSLHTLMAGVTRWVWVDKTDPRIVVLP